MKSSRTSKLESTTKQKLSNAPGIGMDSLITNSSRELVEFYWINRKRFSGAYKNFPTNSEKIQKNY